jgi:hypothetical protein
MNKSINLMARNKIAFLILTLTLIVGGISAQANGILISKSGGYLVCVNSKTRVITHPAIATCPIGSQKLVLGAQGSPGLNGATGLPGKDGRDGTDGNTLWNGAKDPENTLGAPGDMFINSVTKTLFGPKNLDGSWPLGVSMVGPAGPSGPQGPGGSGPSGATGPAGAAGSSSLAITQVSICGVDGASLCKVGAQGPGGGTIFFVDYNDQYAGFNYLEAAPASCESVLTWSSNWSISVHAANGWAARAVGRGQTNTTAILAAVAAGSIADAPAAQYADALTCGSKTDWFLGSLGEMMLMHDNLQGIGEFANNSYWSSSENNAGYAWNQYFSAGMYNVGAKTNEIFVRPVRAF